MSLDHCVMAASLSFRYATYVHADIVTEISISDPTSRVFG